VDGLEVLREVRGRKIVTPVLLLTAKAEIDDRVVGLDAGADDYLTKPFAMKELLARLRAMVRRTMEYAEQDLVFRDIRLKADGMELISGNTVRLSQKEFDLLRQLILNEDHPVDTEYLLSHIWTKEPDADSDTVWLYINYLKRKLAAVKSEVQINGERQGSFFLA
jgi:DNA-binding response OmpR family regulator